MYPREIELLTYRLTRDAGALQEFLEWLASTDFENTAEEDVAFFFADAIERVRTIKFDAARAAAIAAGDTEALRAIYEHSISAVDAVRGRGTLGDPIDSIAALQQAVVGRFYANELADD